MPPSGIDGSAEDEQVLGQIQHRADSHDVLRWQGHGIPANLMRDYY